MGDEYGYLGGNERQSDMTQMGEGRGKQLSLRFVVGCGLCVQSRVSIWRGCWAAACDWLVDMSSSIFPSTSEKRFS
jgi:hypothetical protein